MDDLEKNSIKKFNKWAETYDNKSPTYYFFYFTNKKIVKLLNPKRDSSVLDVGFGTGLLLEQLLKLDRNLQLYGLDISEEMYKKATEKFSKNPQVKLMTDSANKMPYQDDFFDYVACVHSLHHHPNTEQSLKEMKRILKPGGKVIILDISLDGFLRKRIHKMENKMNKEGKVYRYTKRQMRELFEKIGFVNIGQSYLMYFSLITTGEK